MKPVSLPLSLYLAGQVRELDRLAIEEMGIPGMCLMERAGSAAFKLLKKHWPHARRLIVMCGTGNNAGDGYVLARLAYLEGYDITVLQIGNSDDLSGDARITYEAMNAVGLSVQVFSEKKLSIVDVIVDALFGIGLNRVISGEWKRVINVMNRTPAPVLSIDIPSGLHPDTGTVMGLAVSADVTISFIGLKQGMMTGEGPDYCGQIYFDDLQVPTLTYKHINTAVSRLASSQVLQHLVRRKRTAHKGHFGHVLLIGGNQGMIGAIRLAAEAAARVGAGLVSVATRNTHAALINLMCPEIMSHGVEHTNELHKLLDTVDVVAIGPGLAQDEWAHTMLDCVRQSDKPLIIDADALNLMAQQPFRLAKGVITPHPGEAARLLGITVAEVQQNRFEAARTLQLRYGGVCVLKGAGTLVADERGDIGVCSSGNPGMACGGMGDLLTGVISGLMSQGFSSLEAARIGVCLHGSAGNRAAQDGERGMLPTDLLPWLRHYANPAQFATPKNNPKP